MVDQVYFKSITYYRSGKFTEAPELFEQLPQTSEYFYYIERIPPRRWDS